jgi:SAM-dependent methyltransferase
VDLRRYAPPTARNREPILAVLGRCVLPQARVLEVGSGSGEHAVFFAEALPGLDWQPSDPDEGARESIEAWRGYANLPNVRPPLALDAELGPWPRGPFDAVVCINVVHISPATMTSALAAGAAEVLAPGGIVFLYGPYTVDGQHTAPSNEAFDADLRRRDPRWGVRELADVVATFAERGFILRERVEMPANNQSLIFARPGS